MLKANDGIIIIKFFGVFEVSNYLALRFAAVGLSDFKNEVGGRATI